VTTFAFEHYGRGVTGGKPEYNLHLDATNLSRLTKPIPHEYRNKGACAFCWDPAAYALAWGDKLAGQCANLMPVKCYAEVYAHAAKAVPPPVPPHCIASADECRDVPYNRKRYKHAEPCRDMYDAEELPWHGLCLDGARPPIFWCPTLTMCQTVVNHCDVWDPTNKSQTIRNTTTRR
jgi:hypothetical protein